MKNFSGILLLIVLFTYSYAQENELNEYGLYVIDDIEEYENLVGQDSSKSLVDLQKFIPGLKTDVRYATKNNFMEEIVYPEAKVFLSLQAATALKQVQDELKKMKYELKIYDAYRPYYITVKMYENYKDTAYVASPWSGSRHNRGCAVDLTIVSLSSGKELEMPTEYDDFTLKAHPDYNNLSDNVIKNRELLKNIMKKYGFNVYPSEWWHYDFIGWEKYELMDLSFDELDSGF